MKSRRNGEVPLQIDGSRNDWLVASGTFACLLRKAGVDTMTIKDLGRWESLEMVQRYTRSVTFHDSLKFYEAPLS